eukprot:5479033-Prymnesium_polylepis.1
MAARLPPVPPPTGAEHQDSGRLWLGAVPVDDVRATLTGALRVRRTGHARARHTHTLAIPNQQ